MKGFWFSHRIAISLIIAAALLKGIVWSILVPPLYGFDEPLHMMYGRSIVKTHTLRLKPNTLVPLDIWELDEPKAKRTILPPGASSRDMYHNDAEQVVATQPAFYVYHPPLFYTLIALVEHCFKDAETVWEVLGCRMLSVCIGVATAVLAYLAGRIFWGHDNRLAPIVVATIVIYQPMSAFTFATITNSALEIGLFSALLVACMFIIRRGLSLQAAIVLSVLYLAGSLNKMSFVAVAPLILLLAAWCWKAKRASVPSIGALVMRLAIIALPSLLASLWWYCDGWRTGGDSLVQSFEKQTASESFNLIRYICTKPWIEAYGKAVVSYFGHFGWRNAFVPLPYIGAMAAGTLVCTLVSATKAFNSLRSASESESRERGFTVLFLICSTLSILCFYIAIDMRVNALIGAWFTIRGQYYLSAIVGQALCVVAAVQCKKATVLSNTILVSISAGLIGLHFYALLGVVTRHCYGSCGISEMFSRVAELQPLSPALITGLFYSFALLSLLLFLFLVQLSYLTNKPFANFVDA